MYLFSALDINTSKLLESSGYVNNVFASYSFSRDQL